MQYITYFFVHTLELIEDHVTFDGKYKSCIPGRSAIVAKVSAVDILITTTTLSRATSLSLGKPNKK